MKTTTIATLFIFALIINSAYSFTEPLKIHEKKYYAENVHMYICMEALKLLKDRFPDLDFSLIENRIGTMSDMGTRQWQTGKITTGAYREDMEDVVFDIRGPFGLKASCSHFWDADDRASGDHSVSHLSGVGDYPNSFTKMTKFQNGQWFRWSNGYQERLYINYLGSDDKIYRYSYHTRGLINFYRTKKIFLHSIVNILGQEEIIDNEVTLNDNVFHKIVWEVLGRMAHHIADMSVPAHAHNDVHIRILDGGDCYHNFADDGGYTLYNWQTAKNEGGFINPYTTDNDPVRYLMYTVNQIADHFPSGPDCLEIPQQHTGDNNLPGGSYQLIEQYYRDLGSPPLNIANPEMEGQHCFNLAIRMTAGLFYWFAAETGIISPDPYSLPVINSISANLPDNFIYRGETLRLTCNASGSGLNYNWFYRVCNQYNNCLLPVSGLAFNQNSNVYSVTNNTFSNRWTCSYFDSLCNAGIPVNNLYSENPLRLIFGVTVSNRFAQITKFYDIDQIRQIIPFNGIRPPDPPVSGCPVVFSKSENGFSVENNILHNSCLHGNDGSDIEDKLILSTDQIIDTADNTIQIAINESAGDINYFDRIRLNVIYYPEGFDVLQTIYNDLVLIRREDIVSPDIAELNGSDVTEIIAYDNLINNKVEGKEKEILNLEFKKKNKINSRDQLIRELRKAHFPEKNIGKITDSTAIILDPSSQYNNLILNHKRPAGYISVTDSAGIKVSGDIEFARRILRSEELIPVSSGNQISEASLVFKDGFNISYCVLSGIFYGGYYVKEFELSEAGNSLGGDILKNLLKEDKSYAVMDSSSFITLKFRIKNEIIPKGWDKKYVLIIKGRSEEPDEDKITIKNTSENVTDRLNSKPGLYELRQNFPNPFNPVTEINYSIPEDQHVKISVYNLIGRELKLLVNENQNAGNYSVRFNAGTLPSGIYYYKITAGKFTQVRKMIVIK